MFPSCTARPPSTLHVHLQVFDGQMLTLHRYSSRTSPESCAFFQNSISMNRRAERLSLRAASGFSPSDAETTSSSAWLYHSQYLHAKPTPGHSRIRTLTWSGPLSHSPCTSFPVVSAAVTGTRRSKMCLTTFTANLRTSEDPGCFLNDALAKT